MSGPVSVELLRQILDYNPETGALTWRERTPDLFRDGKQSASQNCASWNGRYAGAPAFTSRHPKGYLMGWINNRAYLAHRIIWMLVHGEEPDDIDHINGDRTDNRLANLRNVSRSVNLRNARMRRDNTSGVNGVSREGGRWAAYITVNRKRKFLGYFSNLEDASAARKAAEARIGGFTVRHGGAA